MINATVMKGLRDYYGLEDRPPKINDMSTMTAFVEPDLADCMGCDVQQLYNYGDTYGHINTDWKEWEYRGVKILIPPTAPSMTTEKAATTYIPKAMTP